MAYNSLDNKADIINGRQYQSIDAANLPGTLGNCLFAAVHQTDSGTDMRYLRVGPSQKRNVSLLVGNDGTFRVAEW